MEHRITLNGTWNWCDMESKEWHKGIVPGTVLTDMMDGGLIEDPYWRTNEYETRELSRRDYQYEREFEVPESFFREEEQCLVFEGLDTIADIYLNDELLLAVNDMHRTWRIDVKGKLKAVNRLAVAFHSPTAFIEKADREGDIFYASTGCMKGNGALRKAHYMFGWDWGPQLPDAGIFRSVYLSGFSIARLDDVRIRQEHGAGGVKLSVESSVRKLSESDTAGNGMLVCKITAPDGTVLTVEKEVGINETIEALIEAPQLWWPNGYGAQPLYTVRVELRMSDSVLDVWERTIGLRTVTVCTDADEWGNQFAFVVNGQKIFAMGANYIPEDNLLGHLSEERSERLIRDCARANFNCIRIWGGGYYPEDYVYDACDRYGILVWQDLMFACNVYDLNDEFEANILAETADNVKRIRHHACLGLWCGNNEMESGVINWGSRDNQLVRDDYTRLYGHLLPELCETYAPDTYYWPSSPSSGGGFDDPDNPAKGDTHYWEVWHGGVPFTTYRQKRFRFCSEYGFESFPSMKTIRTFAREEDLNCFSRVMENHQKCRGGNGKILRYLADNYLYPATFENLVYASQLLQADAIKYGVEHFRRQRGYCMGSTYWQFNDCWPVASWSSVDCFGRYKALHYAARKFYAPVAMGLFLENGALTVNIANETRAGFRGHIHLAMCRGNLTVLDGLHRDVEVEALSSQDVLTYRVDSRDPYDTFLYADLYDEQGRFLMRQVELLVPAKHFRWRKPAFDVRIAPVPGGAEISVQADVFAKGVFLDFRDFDCVLSDNFFALTAPAPYRVTVQTSRSVEELEQNLTIKSVYDIR